MLSPFIPCVPAPRFVYRLGLAVLPITYTKCSGAKSFHLFVQFSRISRVVLPRNGTESLAAG